MYVQENHVIHTANGRLSDVEPKSTTSRAKITEIVAAALSADAPELVIHFHGGLVNKAAGLSIAERLFESYSSPNRYPVFFVWESGLIESIRNNLEDIRDDQLFRGLVKKVTRWVLEQLPAASGLKGAGDVDTVKLERQYDDWFEGHREDLPDAVQGKPATQFALKNVIESFDENALKRRIELDLHRDQAFATYLASLHNEIQSEDLIQPRPKASGVGFLATAYSEISPEQVSDILEVTPKTKGVFTLAKTALFIAKVTLAVIQRFRRGRDHGVYTTIVEELLSAIYIDKVGGVIWRQMKKDTKDAFADPATCAGAALLAEIDKQQNALNKRFKRIVLVGHSTGAIYIAHLLEASATLLPDTKFEIVLLAPAVTYKTFAATVTAHGERIANVRRFAMRDAVESNDVLVPVIYLRSLLYFVSGVVEFGDDTLAQRNVDTPLIGMERFQLDHHVFDAQGFPEIHTVEAFLNRFHGHSAWSVTGANEPEGRRSESCHHGDFDNETETLKSVKHILALGF